MKVGFDFDNTIVAFDKLFHKVGVEKDLIPKALPESKIAIRDYLRDQGKEEMWTEMQGFVYGKRILEADPYPQVLDFMKLLKDNSINIDEYKRDLDSLDIMQDIFKIRQTYQKIDPGFDAWGASNATTGGAETGK